MRHASPRVTQFWDRNAELLDSLGDLGEHDGGHHQSTHDHYAHDPDDPGGGGEAGDAGGGEQRGTRAALLAPLPPPPPPAPVLNSLGEHVSPLKGGAYAAVRVLAPVGAALAVVVTAYAPLLHWQWEAERARGRNVALLSWRAWCLDLKL